MSDSLHEAECALRRGDTGAADALYAKAVAENPSFAACWGYAQLLLSCGKLEQAARLFEEADGLSRSWDSVAALALLMARLGLPQRARRYAEELVALNAGHVRSWSVVGKVYVQLGDFNEAENALKKALELGDDSGLCLYGIGYCLHKQRRWSEALDFYGRALDRSEEPGLIFNMALCEEYLGKYENAMSLFQRTLQLREEDLSARSRLIGVMAMGCRFEAQRAQCAKLVAHVGDIRSTGRIDPLVTTYADLPEAVRNAALDNAAVDATRNARALIRNEVITAKESGRLRLGYISPDFADHAVGRLFAGFIAEHARERFHVHAYALRYSDDAVARHIEMSAETFRQCAHASSSEIANLIRNDGIDVLIDLGGYTLGSRPEVLARRPAPFQLGYLGFIEDYRAEWLDGVIMDKHVASGRVRRSFKNRVFDLPGTMFPPAWNGDIIGGTWTRDRACIPDEAVLMCSFANNYKIDERLLEAWVEIVKAAGNVIIMLYASDFASASIRRCWAALGGDVERLVMVGREARSTHLARLRESDLMLDSFRYNGGATSIDALMSGLPVLTLAGERPLARMGKSLNAFSGMDSMVACTRKEYIDVAIEYAAVGRRIYKGMEFPSQHSSFLDGRRVAKGLEDIATGLVLGHMEGE